MASLATSSGREGSSGGQYARSTYARSLSEGLSFVSLERFSRLFRASRVVPSLSLFIADEKCLSFHRI